VRNDDLLCGACGVAALQEIPEFPKLPRVTSDCRPFRDGGKLAVCSVCGAGQALPDERWFAEIGEIYGNYDIYHQSGGYEQYVFDDSSGRMRPRSDVLVDRLKLIADAPRAGKLLDVGCGNGGTMKSFSQQGPWELHGLDLDERNQSRLAGIPGFSKLHTCPPGEVTESFDIITLIHALEHFPDPLGFLQVLRSKLLDRGALFIQVPNASANPFDSVVADHLLHFSPHTLAVLVRRAGFGRIRIFTDWVKKEISLLALPAAEDKALPPDDPSRPPDHVVSQVKWLAGVIDGAQSLMASGECHGIFGSSIAATWLWSKVSSRVQFFVDEDPNRIGRTHLGRPIISPEQVPPGASVFLAMATTLAESIQERLRGMPFHLHMHPPLS